MKTLVSVLLNFLVVHSISTDKLTPYFRNDYTYYEASQNFLKLHKETQSNADAHNTCTEEGATLAYWDTLSSKESFFLEADGHKVWTGAYLNGENEVQSYVGEFPIDGYEDLYDIHLIPHYGNSQGIICTKDNKAYVDCGEKHSFICEKYLSDAFNNISVNVPFFRKDYVYVEKNNYSIKKHGTTFWNYALKTCEEESAELLTVDEKDDVSLVTSLLKPGEKFWLSTNDFLVENSYESVNGKSLNERFNSSFGHCVAINSEVKYESLDCSDEILFACQKRFTLYNFECDTAETEYEKLPGTNKCVKYHNFPKSWHNALELCKIENATLFVINSEKEAIILNNTFMNMEKPSDLNIHYDPSILHVGFHDLFINGIYRTVDGQFLKTTGFVEWSKFYPKPYLGMRCGGMVQGGTIQNGGCDVPAMFACQKKSIA